MAVPIHKTSKSKKRMRRSHHSVKMSSPATCPQCHAPTLPHTACPVCGYYKGRQVMKIRVKKKKEEE